MFGGIIAFSRMYIALMTPARPAVASRWPIYTYVNFIFPQLSKVLGYQTFDFTDPTISLLLDFRPAAKVSESAFSSTGSPAFVPVPCFWSALCSAVHCERSGRLT